MMLHISDHRPALAMAATSVFSTAVQAAVPAAAVLSTFDEVERWVLLIGHIAAALAGLASFVWYGYSFIKARRGK